MPIHPTHSPPPKKNKSGSFLVMANLSEASALEFYDADARTTLAKRYECARMYILKKYIYIHIYIWYG